MTEHAEQLCETVCRIMEVPYHHCDVFEEPRYKDEGLSKAIIVAYPGPMQPWCLAINIDGTISLPTDEFSARRSAERIAKNVMGIV